MTTANNPSGQSSKDASFESKTCGTCGRTYATPHDFLGETSQWRVCSAENLWFNCQCGSTLMLVKGKYSWYSPNASMGGGAASVFNTIKALQHLPHIPATVALLQQLLSDPRIETTSLAVALRRDPLLAAEVMKIYENLKKVREGTAVKNDRNEKDSLEYAITFLGRQQLRELVAMAALKVFRLDTKIFRQEIFWAHSLRAATLGELLARELLGATKEFADRVYLGASLANLGKIVGAFVDPQSMDRVEKLLSNPNTQTTWSIAEASIGLPSHTILGQIGGALWGFPDYVLQAIEFHHGKPPGSKATPKDEAYCHVVGLGNSLAHWIELEPHRIDTRQVDAAASFFNRKRSDLEALVQGFQQRRLVA